MAGHLTRRAAAYRGRSRQLDQIAAHEWREDVRRHLLKQAATFQRAAEQMAPAPPPSPSSANFPRYQINFSQGPCDGAFNRRFHIFHIFHKVLTRTPPRLQPQ